MLLLSSLFDANSSRELTLASTHLTKEVFNHFLLETEVEVTVLNCCVCSSCLEHL